MIDNDRHLSQAFKSEARRIKVPERPRVYRRSRRGMPFALATSAVILVVALLLGVTLRETRVAVAPSASPAATPSSAVAGTDLYGLLLDLRPPVLRSESDPRILASLHGDSFAGAVSPDGRRVAYWDVSSRDSTRALWVIDVSAPASARLLLTLSGDETASVFSGSAVAWSTDGTGLLIAVNSVALDRPGAPVDPSPLYSSLRQVNLATGATKEILRNERGLWFAPLGWAGSSSMAVEIGPGGFAVNYVIVEAGKAPVRTRLPGQTLPAYVRASPDASRILVREIGNLHVLNVWSTSDPNARVTFDAGDAYVVGALWRDARELVVSLSQMPEAKADRLEIWSVGGARRDVLRAPHRLDAVRVDGSAAITSEGAVDLRTGTVTQLPGLSGQVLASVILR